MRCPPPMIAPSCIDSLEQRRLRTTTPRVRFPVAKASVVGGGQLLGRNAGARPRPETRARCRTLRQRSSARTWTCRRPPQMCGGRHTPFAPHTPSRVDSDARRIGYGKSVPSASRARPRAHPLAAAAAPAAALLRSHSMPNSATRRRPFTGVPLPRLGGWRRRRTDVPVRKKRLRSGRRGGSPGAVNPAGRDTRATSFSRPSCASATGGGGVSPARGARRRGHSGVTTRSADGRRLTARDAGRRRTSQHRPPPSRPRLCSSS